MYFVYFHIAKLKNFCNSCASLHSNTRSGVSATADTAQAYL